MENLSEKDKKGKYKELQMGDAASNVFAGALELKSDAIEKLYSESAEYFSNIIKNRLTDKEKIYKIADFGTYKGELLKNILELLPDYKFNTVGIDAIEKNLEENKVVDEKVASDLIKIPLKDKSVDLGIARYVLAWNSKEKQQQILREISRIVGNFAIVQHAGADNIYSDLWREKLDDVFDGQEVPELERRGHYFSSREEIEKWMAENDVKFQRINERKVDNFSEVFIKRYNLNDKKAEITRKLLGDKNYIIQTTWIILSK